MSAEETSSRTQGGLNMQRKSIQLILSTFFCLSALPAMAQSPSELSASQSVDLPVIRISHQLQPELNTPWQISFQAGSEVSGGAPGGDTTLFGLPLNMGPIDRVLRGVIALGLIGTGIYGLSTNQLSAPLSWSLIGVAAIPTATAATGYCPLYQLFGLEYSF